MRKTTIIVMLVTVVAKIFGFLRDKIIWYFFGVGIVSDAFMLAFGVPSLVLTVVAAAFVTGFIPMFSRVKHEEGIDTANAFVSNVFNIMVSLSLILGLVMLFFPGAVVKVAAAGFDPETYALAARFVRVMSLSIVSIAIIQLGAGYLNVNDSFVIPNIISIPSNIITMGSTILAQKTNSTSLMAYGALIGYTIQALIVYVYMRKFGFRYKVVFDFKDPNLLRMINLAGPILISTLVLSVMDLIMMSSSTFIHGKGGYSFIMMSTRLMGFATGLFVTGILSVAYPTIADAASKKDKKSVVDAMNDAILLISLFILPATVGFLSLSYEIVDFVYGGGEVLASDLIILSSVFKGSAIGLLFVALKDLFMRIQYAYHDSVTPLRAQIIHASVGTLLFFALGFTMGIKGLTLALSIASIVSSTYLFFSLLQKFERLGMSTILSDLLKILASSIVMGVVILLSKYLLAAKLAGRMLFLIILVLAVVTYGAMALVLKVEVLYDLLNRSSH